MYDEDNSSEGGSKGSYEIFKAEGDVLYKKEEFQKALSSYTTALDLRPGDKNCLVARAQCYLELGNADAALADAEATLTDDKNFIQGLKQKAEALYTKGNFEFALVFYQRGYKLRPEVKEFRLGIQKAQEAIENSIGEKAHLNLKNDGDLSYFYEEEQKNKKIKKQKGGYSRDVKKKSQEEKEERKRTTSSKDSKTIKQLLGELYADKEYLEKLWEETEQELNDTNADVHGLAADALDYLDSRAEFWQQQKPMYARKGGKKGDKVGGDEPAKYVLKSLEEIDEAQANGKHGESLKKAKKMLKEVEGMPDEDLPNREEVVANLHSLIGNAYLELGDLGKAKEHHTKDREIAQQHDLEDAKSRSLDNLGRVYARMGQFEDAIKVWEEKLPLSKSSLESTWLYHEIGRCHLELGHFRDARELGGKSLDAAQEAEDDVWQLNANVLVAQSLVKLEDHPAALEAFESSLGMARKQKDSLAESAIKKAIEEVHQKQGAAGGKEEEEAEVHRSTPIIPLDIPPNTKPFLQVSATRVKSGLTSDLESTKPNPEVSSSRVNSGLKFPPPDLEPDENPSVTEPAFGDQGLAKNHFVKKPALGELRSTKNDLVKEPVFGDLGSGQKLSSPGLGSSQKLSSPGLGSAQKLSSPGLGSAQKLSSPGLGSAQKLSSPGLGSAQKLSSPGLGSGQKLSSPGLGSAQKLSSPGLGSGQKLSSPGLGSAQKLSSPGLGSAQKLSSPGLGSAQKLSSPGLGSAQKLSSPGLGSAQKLSLPGLGSAENLLVKDPALGNLGSGQKLTPQNLPSADQPLQEALENNDESALEDLRTSPVNQEVTEQEVQEVTAPEVQEVTEPEVQEVFPEMQEVLPEVQEVLPEVQEILPEVQEILPEVQEVLPENQNLGILNLDFPGAIADAAAESKKLFKSVTDKMPF